MRWFNTSSENYNSIVCTNQKTAIYNLSFAPNSKFTPSEENPNDTIRYIHYRMNNVPTEQIVKEIVKSFISEYDNSKEVNTFKINGKHCWFDKATRVGIMNSITLLKADDKDTMQIWFGKSVMDIPLDTLIKIMSKIEQYAMQCYNITQQHYNNIKDIHDVKELVEYDFTANYPNPIEIEYTNE